MTQTSVPIQVNPESVPLIPGRVAKRKLICQNGEQRRKRGSGMAEQHPSKWRHFQAEIILLCVRWYLRYSLSYRDLEEMMRERGLLIEHTTIYRWVQRYAPELEKRCRPHLKTTGDSWRLDETQAIRDRVRCDRSISLASKPSSLKKGRQRSSETESGRFW
jgi:hypothetical protein